MNDNGLSLDIGGNKRKSPGLKIVSEDFLFPTKRMALERNGGYQMETSKDSEDDSKNEKSESFAKKVSHGCRKETFKHKRIRLTTYYLENAPPSRALHPVHATLVKLFKGK